MKLLEQQLTPEAEAALLPIMHCGMRLQHRQLFRVEGPDCEGWLITETIGELLFVVAFTGRGALALLRYLRESAKASGLKRVGWLSFHRKIPRALREFFPVVYATGIPGEYRYTFLTGV